MKESVVYYKAFRFAKEIIILYRNLISLNKEFVLSKQLLRSGTSIGANIVEANGGISKSDFSAKMSVAYKECLESKYWLELMKETDYIDENIFNKLFQDADEIGKILFKILKTSGRINIMDNSMMTDNR
ncbi:MAG: four helix bundle protein [Deltaproteobacteria bacterium]